MFCIVIFGRIMTPPMDCKCDKVNYMLCIFERTLLGGCWRSIIKLSNVWPCVLKSMKQKLEVIGNWYLLIMNVFVVFNSNMWWWYWKFLDMGFIGMTFLRRLSSFMFCNFMFFSMKSLKLTKIFIVGCIVTSFYIHSKHMLLKIGYNKNLMPNLRI
jgi:hypothetical protein